MQIILKKTRYVSLVETTSTLFVNLVTTDNRAIHVILVIIQLISIVLVAKRRISIALSVTVKDVQNAYQICLSQVENVQSVQWLKDVSQINVVKISDVQSA